MANDSQTVPRSVWKGQLSLGFLALPVRFVTAARGITVELNQLHRADHSRLKQVYFCSAENKQVPKEEIVKGYEYQDGQFVVITDEDVAKVAPKTVHSMEVLKFVYLVEVDPIYFDTSYYLEPGEGGEKPYALLYAVMKKSRCCAVTRIAMHKREHVAILRPGPRGIVLQTLFYQDEIRSVAEFRTDVSAVSSEELKLAEKLVEALLDNFDAKDYRDSYRENMMALIQAKVSGGEVQIAEKGEAAPVLNVMDALRKSLAAAK